MPSLQMAKMSRVPDLLPYTIHVQSVEQSRETKGLLKCSCRELDLHGRSSTFLAWTTRAPPPRSQQPSELHSRRRTSSEKLGFENETVLSNQSEIDHVILNSAHHSPAILLDMYDLSGGSPPRPNLGCFNSTMRKGDLAT
ncbi:hypothetical protein V1517DRAFT_360793 [Lipomyces orientalis]|uniref:Uncharacterized protein n=1 Tax=Lipomyces orientalis TaxID=1233043 RepID=A0ACC3TNY7_9ASCO